MDGEIRVFGYELMNYLYCNPFISDEELYKCVYRLTDRFCELDIAILTSEIDEWALDSMHEPYVKFHLVQDVCNRVKALISAGDNGTYRPLLTILTEKDMNDLRVVYDCCSILIEGEYTFGESGEGLNPTIKGKEKGATLLKPIYEKYKDFSLEVKIEACLPNSIGKQGYRRLFYLDKVLELWEKDAEPFIRLFSQTNEIKGNKTSLPKELDTSKAKEVLGRAINVGLMYEDYSYSPQFIKGQRKRFAELASQELGIKAKWKVFQELWGDNGFAQYKIYETNPDKIKFIDRLFSKDIIERCKYK